MPVEQVGQDPAEEHADAAPARGDEAEDAHRLGALGRLGEQVHRQGESDSGDDGAAEALHGPRPDQEALRGREAAADRGDREERDADQEEPAVPEEVAEPAAEQEEAAEGEQIGVYHPGQRGLGEVQVLSDRRQRDVHDRRVEHDHQRGEAQHVEREPALPAVLFVHLACLLLIGCHAR